MDNEEQVITVDLPTISRSFRLTRRDAKLWVKNIQRELAKKTGEWKLVQFMSGKPHLNDDGTPKIVEGPFNTDSGGAWNKHGWGTSFQPHSPFDVRWCWIEDGKRILSHPPTS